IYPVSFALLLISFAKMFSSFRFSWAYRLATFITLIISILQILNSFDLLHGVSLIWFLMLPLADIDFAWLVPVLLVGMIGVR
ncbi:branched-chain amino acid transport system II carrier protein, partial [Staphylococcus aureus]|nr:branched-chain amino acid transport system II carrier protein [Staphylococcus aureus]